MRLSSKKFRPAGKPRKRAPAAWFSAAADHPHGPMAPALAWRCSQRASITAFSSARCICQNPRPTITGNSSRVNAVVPQSRSNLIPGRRAGILESPGPGHDWFILRRMTQRRCPLLKVVIVLLMLALVASREAVLFPDDRSGRQNKRRPCIHSGYGWRWQYVWRL